MAVAFASAAAVLASAACSSDPLDIRCADLLALSVGEQRPHIEAWVARDPGPDSAESTEFHAGGLRGVCTSYPSVRISNIVYGASNGYSVVYREN